MVSRYQSVAKFVFASAFWRIHDRKPNRTITSQLSDCIKATNKKKKAQRNAAAYITNAMAGQTARYGSNMVDSKPKEFTQSTLTYKLTKLKSNQHSYSKQASNIETKTECKYIKHQGTLEKSCKQKELGGSMKDVASEVPAVVCIPEIRRVSAEGVTKVVIDLETSSRADDTEICQIAATDGWDEFNVYIIPRRGITSGASAVNKLRKKRGVLYQGKERVTAVYQNQGLERFLAWLKLKTPCLLIAHNARSFDAKHLLNAVSACKEMCEFSQKVIGFSDSLTAFRERFPERKSYTQTSLAKDILGATYNAHNALDDVRMLQKLASKFLTDELLRKHSFTVSWYRDYLAHSRMTQENMKSLEPLVKAGKVSEGMAGKIAGSGLRISHLEFAYQNGGVEHLCGVLSDLHQGKPRVTNNKRVLAEICSFFEEK